MVSLKQHQIKLRLCNGPLEDYTLQAPSTLQPKDCITVTDAIAELQEYIYCISNRTTADGTFLCFWMGSEEGESQ